MEYAWNISNLFPLSESVNHWDHEHSKAVLDVLELYQNNPTVLGLLRQRLPAFSDSLDASIIKIES